MPRSRRSHSPAADPSHGTLDWLGHDPRGATLLASAQRLLQLETALLGCLPAALAARCKVAALDAQQLTLAVPGPAQAAKLRQLGPTLASRLQAQGWQVPAIRIRVMASLAYVPQPRVRETVPLGERGLQAFADLHTQLHPGPLADAVARLLARHTA